MRRFFSLLSLMLIIGTLAVTAQYDGRQLPAFMKYNYKAPKMLFGKARVLIRGDRYINGPKLDIPDQIMSEDGFRITNISGKHGTQDETWITYNPTNPKNIVASSNNTRYNHAGVGYKMAAYYTTDGGATWAVSTTPKNMGVYIDKPAQGGMTNFDPGMAFDTQGNLYYSYGFTQTTSGNDEGDNGIFINQSTDGGKTWSEPIPIVLATGGSTKQAFHDRYTLTSDINTNSAYKDRLYITWQRFKVSPGVMFSYSADGSDSWSSPIRLSGTATRTQAPMPTVGPNGEIYVAWRQSTTGQKTNMVFQKSTDGGAHWMSTPKTIMTVTNLGVVNSESHRNVLPDKQQMRISSCPYITVDRSNGPRKGWIYVVTAGKDGISKPHIMLTKSTDGGSTWSAIQVIDDNKIGTDVFFPAITVDPVTGMVSVFYYSSQNDKDNHGVDAYIAVSFNGNDFGNFRITPNTWYIDDSHDVSWQGTGNYYWGDYASITSYNGTAYPVFWMPSSPNGSYYTTTSYVAEISAQPMPPSDVTFVNTSVEPTKVILNWKDPTKNRLGGSMGDFKILVYKGNHKIAEVPKGTKTYTDNSAVEGEVFTYNLKTKTSDGLESALVSVSGIAGGSPEPMPPTEITTKIADNGIIVSWKNPSKHIDGTNLDDLNKIKIFADDQLAATVSLPNIQAGQNSSKLVELTPGKFYDISLVAVAKRHDKDTDSKSSDTVFNYAGAPIANFKDNFDDNNKLIPTYAVGSTKWGLTNKYSKSSPNSLTDSPNENYPNRANNFIIFAPTVITNEKPTLSWDHIAAVQTGDYAIVSVSKDLKNWSNIASFDKNAHTEWTGKVETSQWVDDHRTLKDYVGDTLYIRFTIATNLFKTGDGWFIDNVQLDDNTNSVNEWNELLNGINLSVNPNPVREDATINLHLLKSGNVTIEIYNIIGQNVQFIQSSFMPAGAYTIPFNTNELNSGVYSVRLTIDGISRFERFIINR